MRTVNSAVLQKESILYSPSRPHGRQSRSGLPHPMIGGMVWSIVLDTRLSTRLSSHSTLCTPPPFPPNVRVTSPTLRPASFRTPPRCGRRPRHRAVVLQMYDCPCGPGPDIHWNGGLPVVTGISTIGPAPGCRWERAHWAERWPARPLWGEETLSMNRNEGPSSACPRASQLSCCEPRSSATVPVRIPAGPGPGGEPPRPSESNDRCSQDGHGPPDSDGLGSLLSHESASHARPGASDSDSPAAGPCPGRDGR